MSASWPSFRMRMPHPMSTPTMWHLTAGADEFEAAVSRTIEEYKAAGRRSELQDVIKKMHKEYKEAEPLLPAALCYVEGEARGQYLHDMRLCQKWAVLNRRPAPWGAEQFQSGLPLPVHSRDPSRIFSGMMQRSPSAAGDNRQYRRHSHHRHHNPSDF